MNIDYYAKILWNYHKLNQEIKKADIIFGFGSHDTNVAKTCAKLYLDNYADKIIFTGGYGRITKSLWNMTEAEKFAQIAIDMGVPTDKIIIENQASNTGENISKSKELLSNLNIHPSSYIMVDKPYRERRTYATLKKQWNDINFTITSPNKTYEEYCDYYSEGKITKDEFINIMVGDLQRIMIYGENGFQIKQHIPNYVLNAYNNLLELNFSKHLCK